jgi:hypothetical protein
MVFNWADNLFGVAGFMMWRINFRGVWRRLKDLDRPYRSGFFPKAVLNELADGPTHTYLYYYD